MKRDSKNIFELQAEVCKAIAHPKRLEIISVLKNADEMTVSHLVDALRIPKANVSQHLTLMKSKGILASRRDGTNTYYRIAHENVVEACVLMREVLMSSLRGNRRLLDKANVPPCSRVAGTWVIPSEGMKWRVRMPLKLNREPEQHERRLVLKAAALTYGRW